MRFIRNTGLWFWLSPAIVRLLDILNDDRADDRRYQDLFAVRPVALQVDRTTRAGGRRALDGRKTHARSVFDFQNNVDHHADAAAPAVCSGNYLAGSDDHLHADRRPHRVRLVQEGLQVGLVQGRRAGAVARTGATAFDDEKVQGYEVGLKSRWFDRSLLANIAFYDYDYKGLQVGGIEPMPRAAFPVIRTVNAGKARTYGVDFDLAYRPPAVEG